MDQDKTNAKVILSEKRVEENTSSDTIKDSIQAATDPLYRSIDNLQHQFDEYKVSIERAMGSKSANAGGSTSSSDLKKIDDKFTKANTCFEKSLKTLQET